MKGLISRKPRKTCGDYLGAEYSYGQNLNLSDPVGIGIGPRERIANKVTVFLNFALVARRMGVE